MNVITVEKKGHKKSDCFKWKKVQQETKDKNKGKVREMTEENNEQQENSCCSGYSRFLAPVGELESN